MFPRPRGRGRIGCVWNKTTGVWDVDPNYSSAPSKPRVPKHQRFSIVEAPPRYVATTGFTPQELAANVRRNEEESRAIREQCRREAEADALLTKARAEAAARDRYEQNVFFQPHGTASALFTSFNAVGQGRVHVYWLDARGDMYECPEQPYEVAAEARDTKRLLAAAATTFAPDTREVERRVTHDDDPDTLAPGEWEYRRVRVRSIA